MRNFVVHLLALCACLATAAQAQEFPSKPIRVISPASAGTVTDTWLRIYTTQLSSRNGWTVILEPRPGGDNFPATLALLQAPADGLTIFSAPAGMTILPATRNDLPWDLKRDL